MHDFAGCSIDDICGAIGLEMSDLFPPKDPAQWERQQEKPVKIGGMRFAAIDALRCLKGEGSVVLLLACDLAEGKVLAPGEVDRLTTACARLEAALTYLGDNDDIDRSLAPP